MTTLQEEGSATDVTDNHRARRTTMAVVTMRQLLESGVHFGHQTRRWNPKMKRFIMTERNGIYIIDLQQSLAYIDNAYEFVKETVAHGGTDPVRRHQEAGPGGDRRAGDPRRHALRQPALARWHAHQLPDRAPSGSTASRSSRRSTSTTSPAPAARRRSCSSSSARRTSSSKTLGGIRDMSQVPVGRLDRRHQEGAPRRRRGPQARHPGHRDPRHQLRPRRGRLPDPGQRRRDPLGHAC